MNDTAMKLAAVQFAPGLFEKQKNFERVMGYIDTVGADILVFPELALSGYFFLSREESASVAEEAGSDLMRQFQDKASSLNKIICVGFVEKAGDKLFNSAGIYFPDKTLSRVYRKTHLFYKERFCFDPGDTGFFVIGDRERDIRIGTMICYDWRFPESARSLGLEGADLILCPSNLVTDVWHIAMPCRALENKTYLAVANRTGVELREGEELLFKGKSAIYSYNGSAMEIAGAEEDAVLIAEIHPAETRKKSFNGINDIFLDRRPEYYKA